MRIAIGIVVGLVCSAAFAIEPAQRTLSFEDRVNAQAAIERVYYAHQLGATKPFDDAVPRAILEDKVRKYLEQTAALSVYWKTAVTDEMLQHELERMAQGTKMPERLLELYGALGNDPFLIKECLARATLVDRLAHNFHAFDSTLHAGAREEAEQLHRRIATGELSPSADSAHRRVSELVVSDNAPDPARGEKPLEQGLRPQEFRSRRAELPALVGEVSDLKETREGFAFNVILGETARSVRVASYVVPKTTWDAWWAEAKTGLEGAPSATVAIERVPLPVPQHRQSATGFSCTADDTWDHGAFDPPAARSDHTAVWTGSLMVVWGGYGPGSSVIDTGGRYDPTTDTWTSTSTIGAPLARADHTAVWTGSLMVVWGGRNDGNAPFNTGGRYDPAADRWTPMSAIDAPSGRLGHSSVWTGSLMLVWGGGYYDGAQHAFDTGGRYDPATDSWTPISTTGAPSARLAPNGVWTGNLMVVWGGASSDYTPLGTGGRYDPAADAWTPTSSIAAPSARSGHSAVWTGNVLLVWGGAYVSYDGEPPRRTTHYLADGGRYDPVTDSWTPILGGPSERSGHTAVWTGTVMVVWGGYFGRPDPPRGDSLDTGGRYDPASNTWAPLPTIGAPSSRFGHSAVWTGNLVVIWGGLFYHSNANVGVLETQALASGGRYDPASDNWTPTSTTDAPTARFDHTAVWTGSVMVVWGGDDGGGSASTSGGRYDPATNAWTPTSTMNAPSARWLYSTVWTGNVMIVWGGGDQNYLDTGARYDPVSDTWTPTSTTGAPSARAEHTAVWTGRLMLVWGGFSPALPMNIGGTYDPVSDTWAPMNTTGSPSVRWGHSAVWTGSLMVVWGGVNGDFPSQLNTGGRYDPATDVWTPTSTVGAPSARWLHTAVWTGHVMVIWGGDDGFGDTGGRYDPATDSWTPTSLTNAPDVRTHHTAVWTGSVMVVWGGFNGEGAINSGGRYDPATDTWTSTSLADAPVPRYRHTAVWTGNLMLVWGGSGDAFPLRDGGRYIVALPIDGDGDGYTDCGGDCDDANPGIHPGATESCNGVDDDCNGSIDDGAAESCDDGNACTRTDVCSAGLCIGGNPVSCGGLDSCHDAGVCDPATGACSNPIKPDGTSCDDARLCTAGETCQSGTCTPAFDGLNHPAPKSSGYYKKLCDKREHDQLPYQGDQLTDDDAVCVGGLTSTFAGISTIDDICDVVGKDQHGGRHHGGPGDGPNGKDCDKGEDELIATAINICRARVCEEQNLDSRCHGNAFTTVDQAFADADAILDDAARTKDTCKFATCELREINNGHALEMNSLRLSRENDKVRLTWSPPVLDDGSGTPDSYEVWRRPMGSNDAFVKIATTTAITFLDSTVGSDAWEYDITAVMTGNYD